MESDGSSAQQGTNETRPLKRGDACLHCRQRRRRCTAERPSCASCRKFKRDCVYDMGRPVSKVKQLEAKVSQLEGIINTSSSLRNTPSGYLSQHSGSIGGLDTISSTFEQSYHTTIPQQSFSFNPHTSPPANPVSNADHQSSFTTSCLDFSNSIATPSRVNAEAVESFDFSMLDPTFVSLLQSMDATTTTTNSLPLEPAFSAELPVAVSTDSMLDPWVSCSAPSSFSSYVDMDQIMTQRMGSEQNQSTSSAVDGNGPMLSRGSNGSSAQNNSGSSSGPSTAYAQNGSKKGQTLTGGWYDPADLPKVARDHLLDLFFGNMRFLGSGIHVPRFFASLTLPPLKRPHPSLLYSMYLLACKSSTTPSIRALETHFATIALQQVEEGFARSDRLFDVLRACTFLAVYYYSAARFQDGWMMTGRAARLCISCGLHHFRSSEFQSTWLEEDARNDLEPMMRKHMWVISSPQDAVELGERIWALWTLYLVDRGGSIASMWPCSLRDDEIRTPLPRPLYEYELGLPIKADDRSISSIWTNKPPLPSPIYDCATYVQCLLKSAAILARASQLIHLDPEDGWDDRLREGVSRASVSPPLGDNMITSELYQSTFEERAGSTPSQRSHDTAKTNREARGPMQTAKVRTPKAYKEIKRALESLDSDINPDFRTNWYTWDGVAPNWLDNPAITKELYSLHFCIGCSWMFLFDVSAFNVRNDLTVNCARQMVCVIDRATELALGSETDAIVIMTWSFMIKVLVREVKRLHSQGDYKSAAPIEADVEIIASALRSCGQKTKLALSQAQHGVDYQWSPSEEIRYMNMENDEFGKLDD